MIGRLTICDWTNDVKRDEEIAYPSWLEVESAIRRLNNLNLNDVYLQPDESDAGTYLCIGGGDGQYLATGAINIDQSFPTLVDPYRQAEPEVALVIGGQAGDYPGNWIVNLETVLKAARSFYDNRGFAADVNWVNV